jgi:hypothetical protein
MANMDDLDTELNMSGKKPPQNNAPSNVWACARMGGDILADLTQAIFGFIPNGLNVTYDSTLKRLPYLGSFFGHTWVEEALKLVVGITIGRGLSKDLGKYVFWPIGFVLGIPLSLFIRRPNPKYKGSIGKIFYQLSGQTILGTLIALIAVLIGTKLQKGLQLGELSWMVWTVALGTGAMIGMMAKTMMLVALEAVTRANAASSRLNTRRAQKLGTLLKKQLKEKTHQKIYHHARTIIEQMHGAQSEAQLTNFFAQNHALVCQTTFTKIDRHISYLTDRATHGDIDALKKLFKLYRDQVQGNGTIEEMLDRILNQDEISNLKDHVDNLYDKWTYSSLLKKAA